MKALMQSQDALRSLAEELVAAERERCARACEEKATAYENLAARCKAVRAWQAADANYLAAGTLRSAAAEIRRGVR